MDVPALKRAAKWQFTPTNIKVGDMVSGGDIYGSVFENNLIQHRMMVPPFIMGTSLFHARSLFGDPARKGGSTSDTLRSEGEGADCVIHRSQWSQGQSGLGEVCMASTSFRNPFKLVCQIAVVFKLPPKALKSTEGGWNGQ